MEVRIKQGNEMLDATIEMVDGVMVVSPLVVNYKPNNGEVVTITTTSNGSYTCFFKAFNDSGVYAYGGLNNLHNMLFDDGLVCIKDRLKTIYPANKPERERLFVKLAEEGLEWKPDTKELVKLKWKPKVGDTYFRPDFNRCMFMCYEGKCRYDTMRYIKDCVEKGWCFKTKEECQEFCNRLNDAINSVKQ